jgi:hypothetical protein
LVTFFCILIETLWDGVGAVQVYNSLTGIPLKTSNEKGFSKPLMIVVMLTLIVVATFTQLLVSWERKKLKHNTFGLTDNYEVNNKFDWKL